MKKVIASVGLLALGAVGTQTAKAQMTPARTDKPWSVSAALRGFYDDNQFTSPNKTGSFGFEVKPSAEFHVALPQTQVKASYTYAAQYFEKRANDHWDQSHDFELFLNHDFSQRFSVDLADVFLISQESAVGLVTLPFRSNGNNIQNTGSINFHAQLTRLFGVVLGYANSLYDYEEKAGDPTIPPNQPSRSALLDRMEHTFTFDTTWRITEQTTGILGYKYSFVDHDDSNESINTPVTTFVNANTRNNRSHFIYGGADHRLRSTLTASWRVGINIVDYYNATTNSPHDAISPYINASLTYAYRDDGSVTAGFQHTRNQTDQASNSSNPLAGVTMDQESSVIYATVNQRLKWLSPNLTGSATAQYQSSEFNGGPADGAADDIYMLGFNLSYQFNRYFSSEVGYNYDLLCSELSGRSYNRNRVYLGLTAKY